VGLHYRTMEESEKHASTLATSLGCFPVGDGIVPCLRKISATKIVSSQLAIEYIRHLTDPGHGINWLQWIPSIDGIVLLNEPHDTIVNNGTWNRVPIIIGSMRNETDAWIPSTLSEIESKMLFDAAMRVQWGKGSTDKISKMYSTGTNLTYFEKLGLASTDWLMTCYCRRIAMATSKQGVPTFLYQFLHYNSKGADPTNAMQPNPKHIKCIDGSASCHAGDNMYTMGSVEFLPNATLTKFEENISNGIMTTTSRMALMIGQSKKALSNAILPLVPYDSIDQNSLAWGGYFDNNNDEIVATVVQKFRSSVCEFWDTMTPAAAKRI
jgi:carboxylesterase type B